MIKYTIRLLCTLIVLPLVIAYKLSKSNALFVSIGEVLSLLPDLIGSQIRIAYYRMTLKECSDDVLLIGFGSFFTKPESEIGKGVLISGYCTLGMVKLCDHVAIGSGTHILSGKHQHGFTDLEKPILDQKGHYEQITIGENSWIGNGSVIMANLGKHNIIGAGSVISKDTEDYKVIAGNPARVIRDLRKAQTVSIEESFVVGGMH